MNRSSIAVLDAPSNLGLRPPETGSVPGCYKLPWALRDRGLIEMLGARDAGALTPPRYRAAWKPGEGVRNAAAIADYSEQLADRVGKILDRGELPLVLGGDCSILIGNMLALKKRGRTGLVFLDGHSDFRHPGNAPAIGAAAGEDLAIVTGRGDERLIHLAGFPALVQPEDVALIGVRPTDDCLEEVTGLGMCPITSQEVNRQDPAGSARRAVEWVTRQARGFWIHLDFDVVDSSEIDAVDSPEPDGLSLAALTGVVAELLSDPGCRGMELTIFDPDLDPDGRQADALVRFLREAFASGAPR